MGADLTLGITKIERSFEEAVKALKELEPESVYNAVSYWFDVDEYDYDEALAKAIECLKEVYGYYEHGSRDTAVLTLDGKRWLITGGMSWGDDPTDAFRPIALMEDLGVTSDE